MARTWQQCGMLIDPHSATGLVVAEGNVTNMPTICLATAHPAKFPDAVEKATGIRPELPLALADLLQRPERVTQLPNDLAAVKEFVSLAAASHKEGKVA